MTKMIILICLYLYTISDVRETRAAETQRCLVPTVEQFNFRLCGYSLREKAEAVDEYRLFSAFYNFDKKTDSPQQEIKIYQAF